MVRHNNNTQHEYYNTHTAFRKLRTPSSLKLNIKVRGRDQKLEAEAKGPEAEAEARGYEAEAKILASRPIWPRGFNISAERVHNPQCTVQWERTVNCEAHHNN